MVSSKCAAPHEYFFTSLCRSILSESGLSDGSIVDAGANIGIEACHFAEAAPMRTVHAVDPLYLNVQSMKSTVCRTHRNIQPILGGLGAYEAHLHVPPQKARRAGQQITFVPLGDERQSRGGVSVSNVLALLKHATSEAMRQMQNFTAPDRARRFAAVGCMVQGLKLRFGVEAMDCADHSEHCVCF